MADVKIVDIDGEQWNIKDQDAREKIAVIEEDISSQDLEDMQVTMINGYTCNSILITDHYKIGKIHFACLKIHDLSGTLVGTSTTAHIAVTNFKAKKLTHFIARDHISHVTVNCAIGIDGTLDVRESNGINNGSNVIIGELIFAEP